MQMTVYKNSHLHNSPLNRQHIHYFNVNDYIHMTVYAKNKSNQPLHNGTDKEILLTVLYTNLNPK